MAQEKWLVDGPKIVDLERVRSLKIALIGGQIDVVGHDEPGVRVEVHAVSGKELLIAIDGDSLEIDHPQLRWDNFIDAFKSFTGKARAEVSVMVPRDIALRLGVVGASALVSGLTADATVSTVNGDVIIDGVTGHLRLNSVNGEMAVRDHHGRIDVNTVSGDVTVAGDMPRFTCDSVSGTLVLDARGEPDEIIVHTVSGSVSVRLTEGWPTQYRINTVSGTVQLDDDVRGVRGSHTSSYGTLDRRWLELRASTVSGDVSVIHAGQA